MVARIYRPARNAMQSGKAKTHAWVLDYEPVRAKQVEPLMGYTSTSDMRQQVRLKFETQEQAVEYCQRNGIAFEVEETPRIARSKVSYSDNFRYDRSQPWTH
ncbi:ETC complex I subunit [Aureimonas fodinaquatilis]|uniref:ETC complex I subunit n=1 Tax=Aureimonas fodinaquatilis TaxID=2565783 RepID=A0A5B0DXV4_9HYPH|nr:ETC complex I subunit [Aureimonas fodinaquatilis]KAA0970715.1 ETC complex I subunit [Aureimonas fodinaquatilis]